MSFMPQKTIKILTKQNSILQKTENEETSKTKDALNIMVEGDFDAYSVSQIEENNLPLPTEKSQKARILTLQSLFEIDMNDDHYQNIIERICEDPSLDLDNREYVLIYLNKIKERKDFIDMKIQTLATEYPTYQIAIIDRNILRLGFLEIEEKLSNPDEINTTIEHFTKLAYIFGGDHSDRFIKGVLKSLVLEEKLDMKKKEQ